MKRRRTYSRAHRAYVPRLWPQVAFVWALTLALAWIVRNPLIMIPIALIAALAVGRGRQWLWRRQHPQITPSELIDDMRKQAVWN